MNKELDYRFLSNKSKEQIEELFNTKVEGLRNNEIENRLEQYGENIAINNDKKTPMFFIIESFKDRYYD